MTAEKMEDADCLKQSRRSFLKSSVGVVGGLALNQSVLETLAAQGAPKKNQTDCKPNLVIFLGEGLRYDELSCMGNPVVKTPNMDRIAREGMTFGSAFVTNALCLPSRASMLTGLYSHTTGAVGNEPSDQRDGAGNGPIPHDIPLFTELLHQAGYDVGFFGKAHIKGALKDRYWDYYFAFNGSTDYYNPTLTEGIAGKFSEPKCYKGYLDDVVTDRALAWMEQEREKPFCLLLNPF
ncbi:MAG: sulfatase-like hydrolase/transferase, partial [Limisphaerales bacterium]